MEKSRGAAFRAATPARRPDLYTVWADDAERLRLLGARRGVDHTRHDAECQECRDHPTFLCIMEMLYESWSLDLPNGKKLQLKTSWGGIDSCES